MLEPTYGSERDKIITAIDNLQAGGSTAGGEGIELAYKIAKDNFAESGNNRVILATDGDFNVGTSSEGELVRMIEQRRDDGISLSVLGFGMGNIKDNKISVPSENFRFAAAVTEYAMLLRNCEFKGQATYQQVLELAKSAKGHDDGGYRAEFIKMVEISQLLDER